MFDTLKIEQAEPGIRRIWLNRPKSLNAMNPKLIDELAIAFHEAQADGEIRVIILTGAGRAFCAGDDLCEHQHPESEQEARELVDAIQRVTTEIIGGPKPVIGAINGWAVGGGFEWAINCDFALWAESARGFFPELKWGLFVTGGVTSLLPALVGLNKAREMLFLGETYTAAQLREMGLAYAVCSEESLQEDALQLAQKLSRLPSRACQDMKLTLNQTAVLSLEHAMQLETEATVRGFLDPETTKRIAGFSKK